MILNNQKVFYNEFKKSLLKKYYNPFNLVITSKSQSADFIVLGISKNVIYKIVRVPGDNFRINAWRDYLKQHIWGNFKTELIFIYVDNEYSKIIKEEIIELN